MVDGLSGGHRSTIRLWRQVDRIQLRPVAGSMADCGFSLSISVLRERDHFSGIGPEVIGYEQ